MNSPSQSSPQRAGQPKPLWPTLLFGAFLAVLVPTLWSEYRDRNQLLGLHVLRLPFYVPLAFGFIWPLLVEIQARSNPTLRRLHAFRYKVAGILFISCICASTPFAILEIREYNADLSADIARARWEAENLARQDRELAEANSTILANGLAAFPEPLTPSQELSLTNYIASHAHTLLAEQITVASQHYCCNVLVLSCLAGTRNAPAEALQVIYDHSLQLPDDPASTKHGGAVGILESLAANPNSPQPILLAALQSQHTGARINAVGNPNSPKSQKIGYLREAGSSRDLGERLAAASNPATPPDVLEKLASDETVAISIAENPSTPATVLENLLTASKNANIRLAAEHNLDFRRSSH
jgi:hypothetical protein